MDVTRESQEMAYAARKMDSDTAEAGERAASLLSSAIRMCGNDEKAAQLAAAADVFSKRCIQASSAEERYMPNAGVDRQEEAKQ